MRGVAAGTVIASMSYVLLVEQLDAGQLQSKAMGTIKLAAKAKTTVT
jgi:hypothetical protein